MNLNGIPKGMINISRMESGHLQKYYFMASEVDSFIWTNLLYL